MNIKHRTNFFTALYSVPSRSKPGLFFIAVLACSFFACEKEPGVKSSPCKQGIVQKELAKIWRVDVKDPYARTPMLSGDKVLAISGYIQPRTLHCFSASDGRAVYQAPVKGEFYSVFGDRLYASEKNEIWETNLENGQSRMLARFESPLSERIATTTGYVFCIEKVSQPGDSTLYRYYGVRTADGRAEELYRFKQQNGQNPQSYAEELVGETDADGAPLLVLTHQQSRNGGHRMVIKNLGNGKVIFQEFPDIVFPAYAGNLYTEAGKIYFPYGTDLYCIDARSGEQLWRKKIPGVVHNFKLVNMGPYLLANHLIDYAMGRQYLLDKTTGAILLEKSSPSGWRFSPNLVRGDKVFFVGDGALAAWDLKTGCLLNQQSAGSQFAFEHAFSKDGKTMYALGYQSLSAVVMPE